MHSHKRSRALWIVALLVLALLSVVGQQQRALLPDYADGTYRNMCCPAIRLHLGRLSAGGKAWAYDVAEDRWTGMPVIHLRQGIAVVADKIVVGSERNLLLLAESDPQLGLLNPTALILHERGDIEVLFKRVDEPVSKQTDQNDHRMPSAGAVRATW